MAKTYKRRNRVRKSRRRVRRGGQKIEDGFTPKGFAETIRHYIKM